MGSVAAWVEVKFVWFHGTVPCVACFPAEGSCSSRHAKSLQSLVAAGIYCDGKVRLKKNLTEPKASFDGLLIQGRVDNTPFSSSRLLSGEDTRTHTHTRIHTRTHTFTHLQIYRYTHTRIYTTDGITGLRFTKHPFF